MPKSTSVSEPASPTDAFGTCAVCETEPHVWPQQFCLFVVGPVKLPHEDSVHIACFT